MNRKRKKYITLLAVGLAIFIQNVIPIYTTYRLSTPIIAKSNAMYWKVHPFGTFKGQDSLQKFFFLPLSNLIIYGKHSIDSFVQRIIIRDSLLGCPYFHVHNIDIYSYYPINNNRFFYDYSVSYGLHLKDGKVTDCPFLSIGGFIESFIATSDGRILATDTLMDTVINYHRINSAFFKDKTSDSIIYYLSWDKDKEFRNRFRVKTFSISGNDVKLIEERSVLDEFEDTLKEAIPINFCVVPHQNGKDYWVVLYTIHSDSGGPKNLYLSQMFGNIRTYLLETGRNGITISSQPVYSKSFIYDSVFTCYDSVWGNYFQTQFFNSYYPLVFSPDGNLMALHVGNIVYAVWEHNITRYYPGKAFIFLFRFDNYTGRFFPFDSTLSLDKSKIYNVFRYQYKDFVEGYFSDYGGNYYLGSIPFGFLLFSPDSKKLYYGRYAYDFTLSNMDTISYKYIKWLSDSLTPLESLTKYGNKINIDSFPSWAVEEHVGSKGTIYDYMYFPIPNGKFLLFTLNDADTLSTGLHYPTEYFQLKVYEVSNPNNPKNINIKFLFSDTLYAELLQTDYGNGSLSDLLNRVFLKSPSYIFDYLLYGDVNSLLRAFSNSPLCEGDNVILKSVLTEDSLITSFRWVGPNGFEAAGDSIVIPAAKPMHSGWYYCYATVGDTTYTDSVEVEVVPTPTIHFKRGLPVTVCNADSVELEIEYPHAPCCNYFVLWSTGDTTDKVVVRNEGNYWVKVWNELGCWDSVSFEVKFNKPLEVRIDASRDWICAVGDSLELAAESDGNSYIWNDGVSGNRRFVYSPGVYTVVVTNDYGCVDSASISIREEVVNLNVAKDVDFGGLYVGESKETDVAIENIGSNNVKIGRVSIVGDAYEIDALATEGKVLKIGASSRIKVRFTAKGLGQNRGEIIVSVDSPCVVDYRIELLGIGKGKVIVWSPWDTLAEIGWMNYCIPAYVKIIEGKDEDEYIWSGSILVSSKLLRGNDGVIEGTKKKVGTGVEIMRKNEERRLMTLCGDVMMSGQKYEPVELDSFNFGEYVEVEVKDG